MTQIIINKPASEPATRQALKWRTKVSKVFPNCYCAPLVKIKLNCLILSHDFRCDCTRLTFQSIRTQTFKHSNMKSSTMSKFVSSLCTRSSAFWSLFKFLKIYPCIKGVCCCREIYIRKVRVVFTSFKQVFFRLSIFEVFVSYQ